MTARTSSAARRSATEPLAREMVERWRTGDHRPVEQYLARLPHSTSARAALELIAEEFALRRECGLAVSEGEQAERFPQWSMEVRALVRWHHLFRRPAEPTFPEPGETVGDFRLVANLGRGLAGRVYLAKQRSLADRLVVLKLARPGDHEHLCLARLQHTHIVPLLSAHTFPDRGLHALCLPYFGGTSVDRTQVTFTPAAVARLGACLADALQYAHDRDLLHLDVKPSNVLLADDGTPMLLDFHLARPPLPAGVTPPEWLGGTYVFMPPEQSAAVAAVQAGRPLPSAVDARADVYSLGKTLGWLLARTEARVPTGLADVVARASADHPADRYPSAAALADDLRRHLADQPLKGVRNRSLLERWRKWRRRQPLALPLLLLLAVLLAAAVGGLLYLQREALRLREPPAVGTSRSGGSGVGAV
jgi:hypothetical protein